MSTTTADSPSRDHSTDDKVKAVTMTVAAVCVCAQLLALLVAFLIVPKFERVFEDLAAPLPAVTAFAMNFGFSAVFVALSFVALGVTWRGRGKLRIVASVVAVLLPTFHYGLLMTTLFLPLLQITDTLGSGS